MTTTIAPDPVAALPSDGFEDGPDVAAAPAPAPAAPAAKPAAAPVAAAPTPAAAPAAAPAADAKPAASSLIAAAADAPKYDLKAEGLHADDMKVFTDVLGEHKADGKLGQAILDKMLPALAARREKANAEAWENVQKGWREQNAKDPQTDPSKPENQARAKLALDVLGTDVLEDIKASKLVDHPAFNRLVARFGAYVQNATRQDTAVPGAVPAAAPKHQASDQSAAAWGAGGGQGF